jgi:hypothetical protein
LFKASPDVTAEDILHQTLIPGLVFGYSQDLPFLKTSGTGEKMVAGEWDNDLDEMYSAPLPFDRTELLSDLPSDPTELIRDDFKALFEVSLPYPCILVSLTFQPCHSSLLSVPASATGRFSWWRNVPVS